MQFTRKVIPNKPNDFSSLRIAIPPEIREAYDIKPYDLVVFEVVKVVKK